MPTNLVNNGDFAAGLGGWTLSGTVGSYTGQAVFSLDEGPHDGVISQVVSVTPGKVYDYNFNYGFANNNGEQGTVNGAFRIETVPGGTVLASGSFSDSNPINFATAAADNTMSGAFTIPTGVTSVRIVFEDQSTDTFQKDLVIDDVFLGLVCFVAGTEIATPDGPRPVESLRAGEHVITSDGRSVPLRWVGAQHLPAAMLETTPELRPIRIKAGALGQGVPHRDLLVSGQHRIKITSPIVQRMTGCPYGLIAAKKLLDLPGVSVVKTARDVSYWHILCDDHEVVSANGAQAETLLLAEQSLRALSPTSRAQIAALCGADASALTHTHIAAPVIPGKRVPSLLERHIKHAMPLQPSHEPVAA